MVGKASGDSAIVENCIFEAATQQDTQAFNLGRLCGLEGDLLATTVGVAIERQCSLGLMNIAKTAELDLCRWTFVTLKLSISRLTRYMRSLVIWMYWLTMLGTPSPERLMHPLDFKKNNRGEFTAAFESGSGGQ